MPSKYIKLGQLFFPLHWCDFWILFFPGLNPAHLKGYQQARNGIHMHLKVLWFYPRCAVLKGIHTHISRAYTHTYTRAHMHTHTHWLCRRYNLICIFCFKIIPTWLWNIKPKPWPLTAIRDPRALCERVLIFISLLAWLENAAQVIRCSLITT